MANTNPTGPIFAIDANRSVLDLHRRNMTANGATNVTSVHGALGDRDGETRFLENSAFGIVYSQGVPVRMLSPDALIAMGGGVPDFVKMDVEGYEPIILRAAAEHFVKNGTLVHFELNTWCLLAYSRVQPLDFLEWVCDQFTHCYRLDANGADLTRFSRDECTGLLLSNLTQQPYTFLDNIVVTSDADRLANA